MSLKDRVALITGASRGLGWALARAFAREGARLVLCARDADPLNRAVHELTSQGADVMAVAADVGKRSDIERLAATALLKYDHIDILINNASILGPTPLPYLIDTSTDALEEVLRANFIGPFMLTKAVLPSMLERNQGLIINVISDAGIEAYQNWGAYGASKAALDHMTRVWARELAETNVRVNAVDPGDMDTDMHALAMPEEDPSQYPKPEEVVEVFLHLASNESNGVSGERFHAQEFVKS